MDFKEKYQRWNEQIRPDGGLLGEMLREAKEQRERREHRGRYLGRAVLKGSAAVAAICLFSYITLPVLAANPSIYQLMHLVSPGLAQKFVPVQVWDESQGIRMEVVSASIHDNEAQVYITMQDLEGNRIDDTTDLFDSYHIWTNARSSVGGCEKVGYDEETGIVTYLITVTDDRAIETQKVTFSVREFISQKQYYEDIEIPVPLTEAEENPATMVADLKGAGGHWRDITDFNGHEAEVLAPGQADNRFPVADMGLTGLGYVGDALHIQHAAPDNLENDNHGYFSLVDGQGNEILCDYSLDFWGTTEDTRTVAYTDEAFLIPRERLSEYSLRGNFWVSGIHIKGNWQVSFSLGDFVGE